MPAELLSKSRPSRSHVWSPTELKNRADPSPREVEQQGLSTLDIFLLSCGVAAPLMYVFSDVLLALRWEGYSYRDQTISELNAIGAPTRTLSIVLGLVGYAFLVAFGVGVWRSAAANRRLRTAAGGLIALGVLAWFAVPFWDRGTPRSAACVRWLGYLTIVWAAGITVYSYGRAGS